MPVGKNSLARAAKQVSATKKPESVAKAGETKKTPTKKSKKEDIKAIPMEMLSEKVPSDETSRPAVPAVPDFPVTPQPLPAIDVEDALESEANVVEAPKQYALGDDLPYYLL